jgi:hypothetical protein
MIPTTPEVYNALIRVANPTGPLTVTHNTLYNTGRDGINGNFSIGSSFRVMCLSEEPVCVQ